MGEHKREKISSILFWMMVFLFFVFFLSVVHPIVISDTDDWLNSYAARNALPIWHLWNPTKVLPETLMPLVARICAYGVYPFFKTVGIFKCLTVTYAVTVSLAQVLMLYQFVKMLRRNNIGEIESLCYVTFYILCGFWIFRSSSDLPNTYALHTLDASTYFNYVIPNLLSCSLVCYMVFEKKDVDFFRGDIRKNILIVAIYLCIFSNLFSSIIFSVYVGTSLLVDAIRDVFEKKEKCICFFKKNKWKVVTLLLWMISQIMEANGGRADYNAYFGEFKDCLIETAILLFRQLKTMNRAYAASAFIILIAGMLIGIKKGEKQYIEFVLFGILNAVLIMIYELLLCAKVEPGYIRRFDVIYGGFFWITLIEVLSIHIICKEFSTIKAFYVLSCLIIIFNCKTDGKTYRESMVRQDLEPEAAYQICDDIIEQLQKGDKSGVREMIIYVPQFDGGNNWPYGTYAGQRFSEFAYAYGLISNRINVTDTIATTEKNYLLNGWLP